MYCNMMFSVAAYLVERLSGLTFEDFLRQRIWDPLGMKSTNLQTQSALDAGLELAHPSKWNDERHEYVPVEPQHAPEALGAGLVVTSVNDYARWVNALMNQQHPISKEVYDSLTKPRSFGDLDDLDKLAPYHSPSLYSAGLASYYYRGYQVIGHDGYDPGTTSMHFFLPQMKFGCVIFSNSVGGATVHPILRHEILDHLLRVPKGERIEWKARERDLVKQDVEETVEANEKRRKGLCPEYEGKAQPQPGSLESYIGDYWNAGYRGMKVKIDKDQKLVIDATDRTMGFTLRFEHLCSGTKYIAHRDDYFMGGDEELAAEFVFENGKVVKMGLELEADVDRERIWFQKMDQTLPERLK
jgi:hypothetical protein